VTLCSGAFAECTGLEATMEPRAIKAGGSNYGVAQRMGRVSFATVILKRGMTTTRDLWNWFQTVGGGAYAYRLSVEIEMRDSAGRPVLTWALARAPVRLSTRQLMLSGCRRRCRASIAPRAGPPSFMQCRPQLSQLIRLIQY
jgi:phage tail-like protein